MVFGYHKGIESSSAAMPLNLKHLEVAWCRGLTTLMASSAAQGFVHLAHLSVSYCDKIEEIITKDEGGDNEDKEILFTEMKFLKFVGLPRLKRFCGHGCALKFPLLDQLIMERCPKFKIFSPGLVDTPFLKSIQFSKDWGEHHKIWDTSLNKTFHQQRFVKSKELVLDEDDAVMIRNDKFPEDCCPQVEILGMEGFVDEWVTFPYALLERFPRLNELHVKDCSFGEVFPSHAHIFYDSQLPRIQNLKILHVVNCCNLIKLAPSSTSFYNLTKLKVSECHQIVYLVTNLTAKSLVNLDTLKIHDCEKMEEIVCKEINEDVEGEITFKELRKLKLSDLPRLKAEEDKRDINIEYKAKNNGRRNFFRSLFSHNKVLLPKLEILELSKLNSLISLIWDDQCLHKSFSNLKTLIVETCDFMKFVPLHVLKSLNNLEKLKVSFCHKLEMVFGYHKEMESSSSAMPLNLKHLEVKGCDGLTTLMASSAAQGLVHLAHLSVSYCNKIEEIITKDEGGDDEDKEILFTEMKFLKLDDLPRLKRFCGHGCTLKFPLLDQLIMERCPKFKIFSPGFVDTPFLKSIQFSKDWGEHHKIWDTSLNKIFHQQRFVKSKGLVLDGDDAVMIRNDKFPEDCCPQVEILGIEGFVDEWVAFPYALLERFPRLNELHVMDCSFGEIFPSHAHIFYDSQLPRIQNLKILHAVNCCNLIKLAPSSASFYNLTELKVSRCHQIVYLMTNLTAKSLVNLDTWGIYDCEKMEEIVCKEINEDVDGEITFKELRKLKLSNLPRLKAQENKRDFNIEYTAENNGRRNIFSHNKVLLPKLEILELSNLSNNLISLIWDDQLLHNSFNNLKTLIMKSCKSLKLVPLCVLKSLNNLEKLEVSSCDKLEKVFGYEDLNDYYKENESSSVVVPQNLTHLEVEWCDGLTTLMTSSTARSLVHLHHLSVRWCNQIKEIITKDEGGVDEDKEILFTEMEFLKLDNLQRLKSFCGYNYTFKFPLLEQVTIKDCPHLTMFCLGDIHAQRLHSVRVNEYPEKDIWKTNLNNTVQHLFTFQEVISTTWSMALNAKNITTVMDVFPIVRYLYVESFKDEGVTFPYRSLEGFPNMNFLYVEDSSFEEIFPSKDEIIACEVNIPPLKRLYISYLDKLKSIWKDDFQLPPIPQNLEFLEVKSCCNLAKLAPSSALFENLRWLSISGCHQLIYLVTTSTVKSLVSLRSLKIHDCKKMEEIVMNKTNEDVEGGITFNRLCEIELTEMPSLQMFSSQNHSFEFPKLEEIKVTGCPKMKMLCPGVLETPNMSKVKIEEHDIKWEDERDLNKIIQRLSSQKDSVNM